MEKRKAPEHIQAIGRAAFLFLLFSILAPGVCRAKVVLLLARDFGQTVSFKYSLDDQRSSSAGGTTLSLTQHRFDEGYDMGFTYAIFTPRLLTGTFNGSASLDQEKQSGDQAGGGGSGLDLAYNLRGFLLQEGSAPTTFFSFSQLNHSQSTFVPSYDIRTDGLGANLSLKNSFLPARISYSSYSYRTSGLNAENTQESDSFSASVSHGYRDLSSTTLSTTFSHSDSTTGGTTISDDIFGFGAENTLMFRHDIRRELRSSYLLQDETGPRQLNTATWRESLAWAFGKALLSGVEYSNIHLSAIDQHSQSNYGSIWLQHSLFESLTTHLEVHGAQTDFSTGRVTETGGTVSVAYTKKLPRQSLLHLNYTQSYSVTENKTGDTILKQFNELHTVPDLPPLEILLNNPDIIHASTGDIVVKTRDGLHTYTEGVDYTVRQQGVQTFIVIPTIPPAGSIFPITPGTVLSIDYSYHSNISLKYATTGRSASASLYLDDNHFLAYARMTDTSNEILEGNVGTSRISDTSNYKVGFERRDDPVTYGASYDYSSSSVGNNQTLNGYWRYTRNYGTSSLQIDLRDLLTLNSSGSQTGSTDYTNSIQATTKISKLVLPNVLMKANGSYKKSFGREDLDTVETGLELSSRVRRIDVAFSSSAGWYFSNGSTSRYTRVSLSLIRNF
jgi:hypothetical protein